MKVRDRYAAYLLAADAAFYNKDVSEIVKTFSKEQRELFDSSYARYKEDAALGYKCPIIEIPYDYGEDDDE